MLCRGTPIGQYVEVTGPRGSRPRRSKSIVLDWFSSVTVTLKSVAVLVGNVTVIVRALTVKLKMVSMTFLSAYNGEGLVVRDSQLL